MKLDSSRRFSKAFEYCSRVSRSCCHRLKTVTNIQVPASVFQTAIHFLDKGLRSIGKNRDGTPNTVPIPDW